MDAKNLVEIEEKSDIFSTIFNFVESFFAFGIATVIIISAGYKLPFYLIGVSYILIGVFGYYVYQNKSKGTSFLIMIFSLLAVNVIMLTWVTVIRMFYKRDIDTPHFFA